MASPPPATDPFQAPDFGEDDTFPFEEGQASVSGTGMGAARRQAG
ncbi:hypothetical protein [Streptomyces sp. NPDC007904]